jgi:NADPH:quinone reductase-like Zn-dependent oxidoreductase
VLINGASGAVGTWAVQVAKALGARVTAVCSTRHLALVRSLGADELVDYTCQDFVQGGARFDVMFDIAGSRSLSECLEVLTPTGTYVACSGSGGDWLGPLPALAGILARSLLTRRKLKVFVMAPRQADLLLLKELVEAGKARPVLERTYPLAEAAEALRQVGEGHSQGLTVLRVAE